MNYCFVCVDVRGKLVYQLCCASLDGTGYVLGVPSLDLNPAVVWALLARKWGCPDLYTLLLGCKARRHRDGVICCPGAGGGIVQGPKCCLHNKIK